MPYLTMPYSTSSFPIRFLNIIRKIFILWTMVTIYAFSANAQPSSNAGTEEAEVTPAPEAEMASSASEAPLYPSRAMRDKTLIAKALDDEGKWLDTAYGKILVMHRPTEAKVTKGVLVLFHAAEDPQLWPPVLENLRSNLPRYGWETLAVTMPQAVPKPIPERENTLAENANNNNENNNEDDENKPDENPAIQEASASSSPSSDSNNLVSREELIKEYIKVSFEFLHANGQFNAVVLFDNSSLFPGMQQLLPQIKENKNDPNTIDGPIQALVIANLQPQEALNKQQLNITLNQKQLPVMDIFFAPDVEQQKTQRELHRAAAMRNKLANYQQFITELQPKSIEDDHSSFLVGRVRGFMKAVATGSEIKTEK